MRLLAIILGLLHAPRALACWDSIEVAGGTVRLSLDCGGGEGCSSWSPLAALQYAATVRHLRRRIGPGSTLSVGTGWACGGSDACLTLCRAGHCRTDDASGADAEALLDRAGEGDDAAVYLLQVFAGSEKGAEGALSRVGAILEPGFYFQQGHPGRSSQGGVVRVTVNGRVLHRAVAAAYLTRAAALAARGSLERAGFAAHVRRIRG
jgi:hypothetical protein